MSKVAKAKSPGIWPGVRRPLRAADPHTLRNIVACCAVLHQAQKYADGQFQIVDVDWVQANTLLDEERIRAQSGNGSADADGDADGEEDAVYDDTFDSMRVALVKHFSILKERGELGWLT